MISSDVRDTAPGAMALPIACTTAPSGVGLPVSPSAAAARRQSRAPEKVISI